MIDENGAPRTIEFNCRFGDPETQPIMSRLDSDLADLVQAALDRRLDTVQAEWNPQTAVGVVLARRRRGASGCRLSRQPAQRRRRRRHGSRQ